jgi:MerR family transcriptional regulator/heat shock protein HspR
MKRVRSRRDKGYTISAVAEAYSIHPQTLRLYERQGLLKPSRSRGNTRYYTEEDLSRLELILTLTRDLGVNLAGVEVILNMREKMDAMQREIQRFLEYLRREVSDRLANQAAERFAIVPLSRAFIIRPSVEVLEEQERAAMSDGGSRRKPTRKEVTSY